MKWTNYHSHSNYCDGKMEPEDFVKAAASKGFYAYGFSSHAPVPFPSYWNMPQDKLQPYLDDINRIKEKYRDSIQIYTGLEIDYIEGHWSYKRSFLKDIPLDYRIGSVHYLDQLPDGTFFCFDGKPDDFFNAVNSLYGNNFKKAIKKYYRNIRQMIEQDTPHIIGHLDKIKMHNNVRQYLNEEEEWYIKEIEDTLDILANKKCIVEVNTRGLYRHDPPVLYPSQWILERMFKKEIPVMINSDAHHPSEIDTGYDYAFRVIQDTGWRSVKVLVDGDWCDAYFDKNGLITEKSDF